MDSRSIAKVLGTIKESDRVLDVGGWAQPLKRANAVIDCSPYETRGGYGSIGDGDERFKKSDWTVWDICNRKPWPFKDKEFDFVTCSHVLEDLRDPLWVCSEIVRVGKKGYIETPSRAAETLFGVEGFDYPGSQHHRWLIEIENNSLTFFHKSPLLQKYGIYILNSSPVVSFFWEGTFESIEKMVGQPLKMIQGEHEQWLKNYKSNMPTSLLFFNGISRYIGSYLKKNVQKMCRALWRLPKV
jgi:hypothetical protein